MRSEMKETSQEAKSTRIPERDFSDDSPDDSSDAGAVSSAACIEAGPILPLLSSSTGSAAPLPDSTAENSVSSVT